MRMLAGLTDTRGSGGATAQWLQEVGATSHWCRQLLRLLKSQCLLQSLNDRGAQFFRPFNLGSP